MLGDIDHSELDCRNRSGGRSRKSITRLKKEGYKVVDIPSDTQTSRDKYPHNKTRRFGHYFIEKCTLVGYEIPGEYFQEVTEIIERNTVYLFATHQDALIYFKKKLFKVKSKNLF